MINQNISCLFWNYRRASRKAFFHVCNSYIQAKRPDMLVIMETRSDPSNLNRAFSHLGFTCFSFSEARGFVGGMAIGWKTEKLQVHILKCHFQFIHSQIIFEEGKFWHISTIYASSLEDRKKELWNELADIATFMSIGWIVGRILMISST